MRKASARLIFFEQLQLSLPQYWFLECWRLVGLGVAGLAVVMRPATAGVIATGFVFASPSFLTGQLLDYLDKQHGYSQTLTEIIKGVIE